MEIYTYLLYSGSILGLLSLFYWLLLSKETFFQANRWVLIGNIGLACLIPLIPAPTSVSQLKQDLIVSFFTEQNEELSPYEPSLIREITTLKSDSSALNEAILNLNTKEEVSDLTKQTFTISKLLKWGYLIGFFIMLFRFLIQLFYVFKKIKRSDITKGAGYYLATNNKDFSPFSFWKYIVVNPNKYDESSFLHILEHERIHVLQRHTFDLVLAELFLIIQWFNPLAWWHRHWVDQNLEFLVDQTLLDNGENKKLYQYHLVQVAVPNSPLSISSNYNSSQLKKRIKMMNLQRSSIAAFWKYALLLPIAFLLLVGFTTTSNSNEPTTASFTTPFKKAPSSSYVIITEDASQEDLKALQEQLYEFGYVLSFDRLIFDNDKIMEMDALLDYNDEKGLKIPEKWEKDELSPKVALFVNEDFGRFGHFENNEIIFEDLENNIPKEQIFIAGNFSLVTVLEKLRAQHKAYQQVQEIQFQKDRQDPNWKGKLTKFGIFYTPPKAKDIDYIKNSIKKKGFPTTYYLDGIQNDESALDIPILEIEKIEFHELRYRKFDKNGKYLHATPWNYEVKIKRKGKQNSTPKELNINELDEIYIILTEEASRTNLTDIQSKLLKYGLELSIKNLVYNDAHIIESIEVELIEEGGSKVNMSWTKAAKDYKFMVLYRDWKNDKTGVGNDLKLLKKARQVNENGKLFMVGEKHAKKLNQLLLEEAEKAKKVKAAKESNPIQLEQDTGFIHIPKKPHYVLCPTTVEDFEQVKSFFKENIFMRGLNKRYSSIYFDGNNKEPLIIIRKFDNFDDAETFVDMFNNIPDKPKNLKLFSANQPNYRQILLQKSFVKYEEFYNGLKE